MFRRFVFLALFLVSTSARAEPPVATPGPALRFKWQPSQVMTYKVLQKTVVRETNLDEKSGKPVTTEASTNLALVKKWQVKEVDSAGTATLAMSISEMRNEIRRPGDANPLVVDSANPEDAMSMASYLNVPILTLRVDSRGRIVEVKESKSGSESRLKAELPFRMILPDTGPVAGQSWERNFPYKLDPPLGTGESYEFTQKYTCSGIKEGLAIASVETSLKLPPKAVSERVPLVPMIWSGEVYFNTAAGKFHAARLKAKAELFNYQGEGSKFEYESIYAEDAVEK